MDQILKGARVTRLASPDRYVVPAGTAGTVVYVYEAAAPATAYDVRWDGRETVDFAAGSRIREAAALVSAAGS